MKKVINFVMLATSLTAGFVATTNANQLDDLLKQVKADRVSEAKLDKKREAEFNARKDQQNKILSEAVNSRDNAIALSTSLEQQFQKNELAIGNNTEALNKRMGELKELFGVLQQVAGDTRSKFQTSVVSAQIPGRGEFLDQFAQSMASTSKLASIEEIERLWFELQREMTQTGKVHKFTREIVVADGSKVSKELIRVGGFNLVSDGKYLEYIDETGSVAELIRQPSSRYLSSADQLSTANNSVVPFALDPTGGSILGLLVQAPDTQERVDQGGSVGYVILAIGLVGLLIAIERFITLFLIGGKVNRQLKENTARADNPLGRVMLVKDKIRQIKIIGEYG